MMIILVGVATRLTGTSFRKTNPNFTSANASDIISGATDATVQFFIFLFLLFF